MENNKIQTTLNFPILYIKKAKEKVIIDSSLSNDSINLAQTINKKHEFIEYNDDDDDGCVVECNNDINLAQTINKKHKLIEYNNDNTDNDGCVVECNDNDNDKDCESEYNDYMEDFYYDHYNYLDDNYNYDDDYDDDVESDDEVNEEDGVNEEGDDNGNNRDTLPPWMSIQEKQL